MILSADALLQRRYKPLDRSSEPDRKLALGQTNLPTGMAFQQSFPGRVEDP